MASKVDTKDQVEEIQISDNASVVQKVDKKDTNNTQSDGLLNKFPLRILTSVFFALEIFLLFKFILEFMEANPDNIFYQFIDVITAPVMFPFNGLFTNYNFVIFGRETNVLFAMFAYFLLYLAVIQIIRIIIPQSKINQQE